MFLLFQKWWCDKSGATAIEYSLMVAGISLVLIAGVFTLGGDISELFAIARGWLE